MLAYEELRDVILLGTSYSGMVITGVADRVAAIAGVAVADAIDPAELLDVDVDHLARMLALVAAHRFAGLQRLDPVEPDPLEDTADGCRRQVHISGDLLTGVALAA